MSELGRFRNCYGEEFILSRRGTEIWIEGDEFDQLYRGKPHNVARLDFIFSTEEKEQIDRIVPLVWDFAPDSLLWDFGEESHEPDRIRARSWWVKGLIAAGFFPEATHEHGHWTIWDTAEQEAFLRQSAGEVSMAQYALLRGFETPEAGGDFLHSYAERAGCTSVTHLREPSKCWFGNYDRSMASWIQECDEDAQRMQKWMRRLAG